MNIAQVLSKSGVAMAANVGGALGALLLNFWIARHLGSYGVGVYQLITSLAAVLATIGSVGLGGAVLRFIAASAEKNDWQKVADIYKKALHIVIPVSVAASALIAITSPWLATSVFDDARLVRGLQYGALSVPFLAVITIQGHSLLGLRAVAKGWLLQGLGIKWITLIILFGVGFFATHWLTAIFVVQVYASASIAMFLLGAYLWKVPKPAPVYKRVSQVTKRQLLQVGGALLWVSLMDILSDRASMLIIGIFRDQEAIGLYAIASRCALLISMGLVAMNSVVAPAFSALYSRNDLQGIRQLGRKVSTLLALGTLPIAMVCVSFPEGILVFFGEEFVQGTRILQILVIGQYINVLCGPVGTILVMTGHEKDVRNQTLLFSGFEIAALFLLVPLYGTIAAAVITGIAIVGRNLANSWIAYKRLGIIVLPSLSAIVQPVSSYVEKTKGYR